MVFILSNQYEKRYTPYMAKVAPQHLVHTPQLGRQPKRMSMTSSAPMKAFWRFIRNYLCHNTKLYYTYVLLVGMGAYNFHYWWIVSYYRRKNYFRSLEYAMEAEKQGLKKIAQRQAAQQAALLAEEEEEQQQEEGASAQGEAQQ